MNETQILNRLIYIAHTSPSPVRVPEAIKAYVPFSNEINQIAQSGLSSIIVQNPGSRVTLENYIEVGSQFGSLKKDEFQHLVCMIANKRLQEIQDIDFYRRMEIQASINSFFFVGNNEGFIDSKIVSLTDIEDVEAIPLIVTGFTPMDKILGYPEDMGVPINALVTHTAVTGHGKSVFAYAYAYYGRKSGVFDEVWIKDTEIGEQQLKNRTKHVPNKPWVKDVDLIFFGSDNTVQEIALRARENPNPKRLIILDSPDSDSAVKGGQDGLRFALSDYYIHARIAANHSGVVLVTSQPNPDGYKTLMAGKMIHPADLLEAKSKAQDSVAVTCHINQNKRMEERSYDGFDNIKAGCVKSRYAPTPNIVTFRFNYATLQFQMTELDEFGGEF